MFKGRRLLIATMHQKQQVIKPLMEQKIGVKCFVPKDFNTDLYGMFSGEVPRELSAMDTVRKKCLEAMEREHCNLGIASEGSFGPHPSLYFANVNEEILILIDLKNNLEIVHIEWSLDTNFNGKYITNEAELMEFAQQVKFPSHGIILKKSKAAQKDIIKGIVQQEELLRCYNQIMISHKKAYVETDMRAMYNPTRMKVIETATENLIAKINSCCPLCKHPGFDVSKVVRGLKCSQCYQPTKSILSHIYQCKGCNYKEERLFPKNKKTEDPGFCDFCNP